MDVCRINELCEDERSSGVIYAVEYEDGIVKIGYTRNILRRLYQLRRVYRGKEYIINKIYVTECVTNARCKERSVMEGFTPVLNGKNECFKIPFEIAVDKIKTICGGKYQVYANCIEDIMDDSYLCNYAVNPMIAIEYHMNKVFKAARELGIE